MDLEQNQTQILLAKQEHIKEIVSLHIQYITGNGSLISSDLLANYYQVLLERSTSVVYVAIIDGQVAGYASLVANHNQAMVKALFASPLTLIKSFFKLSILLHLVRYLFQKASLELLGNKWPKDLPQKSNTTLELRSVAVNDTWRGQSIGTLLLKEILNYCVQIKCEPVVAWVEANNMASNRLFLRVGFELIGVRHDQNTDVNIFEWKSRRDIKHIN